MRILVDTSILVEVDRGNTDVISLMEQLTEKDTSLFISTITASEILTGVYLQKEPKNFILRAKELLFQFKWVDLDPEIAEETAKMIALNSKKGRPVDYQDVVIAATAKVLKVDKLLTTNIKHFQAVKGIISSPKAFLKELSKKSL